MPHLKIEYTANLDAETDIGALCKSLARTVVGLKDEHEQPVFPLHGTRVLAYPAPHYAVADGEEDRAFVYLNLRITPGRSPERLLVVGDALLAQTKAHFAPLLASRALRITLHIDEGRQVYEGKAAS
jgi:5-carboxymethyl-2-hydroxymuconate isomerase